MANTNITLTGTAVDTSGAASTVTVAVSVVPVVTPPQPPVMAIPTLNPTMPVAGFTAGTLVTVTFSATDPQGQALTYTASASDGRALSPVAGQAGSFTFTA